MEVTPMYKLGQIVKVWQEGDWDLLNKHRPLGALFRRAENVGWLLREELEYDQLYAFVQPTNNGADCWARIGRMHAVGVDGIWVDFGRDLEEIKCGPEVLVYKINLSCNHEAVDTGLLMGWCRHCNVTMMFNRKTAKYEA
jgi:hypothetical protein